MGKQLPNTNLNTFIISLSVIVFMMIMNELVKVGLVAQIVLLLSNLYVIYHCIA